MRLHGLHERPSHHRPGWPVRHHLAHHARPVVALQPTASCERATAIVLMLVVSPALLGLLRLLPAPAERGAGGLPHLSPLRR